MRNASVDSRAGCRLRLVGVLLGIAVCLVAAGTGLAAGETGNVAGIWRTGWVDLMLRQGADGYVRAAFGAGGHGHFEGMPTQGALNAVWSATPKDGRLCAQARDGEAYWGEVEIRFGDGELSGSWSACGEAPTAFTGRRLSALARDPGIHAPETAVADAPDRPAANAPAPAEPAPAKAGAAPQESGAAPRGSLRPEPQSGPQAVATTGDRAFLERRMPLGGEFPLPMSRSDNPRTWSVVRDTQYPAYAASDPVTGLETLTWKYEARMEATADPEGESLYETYITIVRGEPGELERRFAEHRAALERRFEERGQTGEPPSGGDRLDAELSGVRRIQDFNRGLSGYILVRADRTGMHELRMAEPGLLVTVRCSPWFGGMDYCDYVGAAVDLRDRKAREAGE